MYSITKKYYEWRENLLAETTIKYDVWSSSKKFTKAGTPSEAFVYSNKDLGKTYNPDGYYVEVDYKFDNEFKNKAALVKWLKKGGYTKTGVGKGYL